MLKNQNKDFQKYAKSRGVLSLKLDYFNKKSINNMQSPYILEERQLNVTQMDVFSRLMMDRIIFFGGVVNTESCNIVNAQLLYLDNMGVEDIKLYINSPGGDVASGLATIDTMNFIKSDVQTYCMGMCASMGAMLLTSGEKGKRYSLPHGRIMLHQPLGEIEGQASDIEITARHILKTKKELYDILVETTGQSYETIEKNCDRDHWLTAQEALDYGVIDKIINKNIGIVV